jgi:phosphoribosyl 1,2-cyclic phosphodiesterase
VQVVTVARLTFYGVRGSTPSFSGPNQRYGGNTASVDFEEPDEEPILFDLGTGLRPYGATCPMDGTFAGTALVTHIHWDHVQGLPFFPPVHVAGARLDIYGPHQQDGPLTEVMDDLMRPPYFPVRCRDLAGEIRFHDVTSDTFAVGSRKVTARPVPHVGPTVGYRVEGASASVTYISDHQAPLSLEEIADSVLELADGVDVLIHDCQYTREEFARKSDWGHCTTDYALRVAAAAHAKRLVMFHHDPGHSDEDIDGLAASLQEQAAGGDVEVLAAYEGMVIDL